MGLTTTTSPAGLNDRRTDRPGVRPGSLLGTPTAWSAVAGVTVMSEDDIFRDPFAEFLPSSR
jgi:hypothetical protein